MNQVFKYSIDSGIINTNSRRHISKKWKKKDIECLTRKDQKIILANEIYHNFI